MTDSEQLDQIRCGLIDLETLLEKILAELQRINRPKFQPPDSPWNLKKCLFCGSPAGHFEGCPHLRITAK